MLLGDSGYFIVWGKKIKIDTDVKLKMYNECQKHEINRQKGTLSIFPPKSALEHVGMIFAVGILYTEVAGNDKQ